MAAVHLRNRVRNRVSTSALKDGVTLHEKFFGEKSDISTIRVFRCKVYSKKNNPKLGSSTTEDLGWIQFSETTHGS